MKISVRFFLFLFVALITTSTFAADTADKAKMEEMMKSFKEYSTPGPQHKTLAGMVGHWTYTSKMWMSAAAAPQESKGTANFKMIMGGRYLQQNVKGKAMMNMPFDGMALTGYNNLKKNFETLWIDSMGTGMTQGTSTFDEKTSTFSENGTYTCPQESDKVREYRAEWKLIDKNNMIYSMFGPGDDGKEYKHMEMTYKRK
ncbi:MAG: DUF1579 domain-containing protein [Bdellovibrionales bacterium]